MTFCHKRNVRIGFLSHYTQIEWEELVAVNLFLANFKRYNQRSVFWQSWNGTTLLLRPNSLWKKCNNPKFHFYYLVYQPLWSRLSYCTLYNVLSMFRGVRLENPLVPLFHLPLSSLPSQIKIIVMLWTVATEARFFKTSIFLVISKWKLLSVCFQEARNEMEWYLHKWN